jgi:hypothetical protein
LSGATLNELGRGGTRVIVTEAVFDGSAWLVAVTVTVCCVVTEAGAVYRPGALQLPALGGAIVQMTAGLAVLLMLTANCCDWPTVRVTLGGVKLTVTGGSKVTVAEMDRVESPRMVPVIATVCCVSMLAGAV